MNATLQARASSRTVTTGFPNFLIVGVMKAATTALSTYLNRHPSIYLPERELHYFDRDDRYEQGSAFYRALFVPAPGERWVGEKTPTYSYHPACPARIAAFNPDMRLIWIFRNPTERAYSHYWYFVQNGQEQLSFEDALAAEPVRRQRNVGYAYRDRGLYSVQIERYLTCFPRDRMLFVLHEDLKREPERTVGQCLDFLGTPRMPHLTRSPMPENVTRQPRVAAVQRLAYRYLYQRFNLGYRIIHRFNTRAQAGYPPLPIATKAALDAYYAPFNARLAELTGLDLGLWK